MKKRLVEAAELERTASGGRASRRRSRRRVGVDVGRPATTWSRWRPGRYSRSSRPAASASCARGSRARPPSRAASGRPRSARASASSSAASSSRQRRLERDVVVQQQHVLGRASPRRRGCRGSRGRRFGAASDASRRRPSATAALPSVELASTTITSAGAQRLRREAREAVGQHGCALVVADDDGDVSHRALAAPREQRAEARRRVLARRRGRGRGGAARASAVAVAEQRRAIASASSRSDEARRDAPAARAAHHLLRPARRRDDAGTPQASASATAMPKPSWREGETSSAHSRSSGATSATTPVASTPAPAGPRGGAPISRSRAAGSSRADERERVAAAGRRSCAGRRRGRRSRRSAREPRRARPRRARA